MTGAALSIRRAGDAALLVETNDLAVSHRLNVAVRDAAIPGIVDVVPGEHTVLVITDPGVCDLERLASRLPTLPLPEHTAARVAPVEIPTIYDGADVDEVAKLTGLPAAEVIARHAASSFTVAYLGFSPGFGYLTGLDPVLHVPRRDSPRTVVPTGSVAVAGPYAAVYPSQSPGGWRLLGRTHLRLWDVTRTPPSLLQPGTRVRFVPQETRP